eukprot:TRINITY_DN14529_c0_g1_i1.p1 TRINITY_DN14529_c0_g1~~TRINITY_DN14529_c0_g1_i1.p1  ORF type:complete len:1189 (-),score=259.69 TRINITY_DN14529_c0_g1_i1:8-3574(-)
MENLCAIFEWRSNNAAIDGVVTHFCTDPSGDVWIAAKGGKLWSVSSRTFVVSTSLELHASSDVVSLDFVPDCDGIVATVASGEIFSLTGDSDEIDAVGAVDGGVVAARWSPDFELFAVVSGVGDLLLLTKEFELVNERPLVEGGVVAAEISWRGDGAFFAATIQQESSSPCRFRVFQRDGTEVPLAVRDIVTGGSVVAWQPSGATIAVPSQLSPNAITLLERIGHSRAEISLRGFGAPNALLWDCTSQVLAAQCGRYVVVLSVANAYWYIRRVIACTSTAGATAVRTMWDPAMPLKLRVLWSDGSFSETLFSWRSSALTVGVPHHESTETVPPAVAAVVDGARLLITPLARAVVPPPMSMSVLEFAACIAGAFVDGKVSAVACINGDFLVGETGVAGPLKILTNHVLLSQVRHVLPVTGGYVCASSGTVKGDLLLFVSDDGAVRSLLCDGAVTSLLLNPTGTPVAVLHDGRLGLISCSSDNMQLSLSGRLPAPCVHAAFAGLEIVSLTSRGRLFVGDAEVADGVGSFALLPRFLLYTSRPNKLEVRRLPFVAQQPMIESRITEPGATLVTVMGDARVVLQIPRGNVETVVPRSLLLTAIKQSLEVDDWLTAWGAVRRHRIDANVLYDHEPAKFASSVNQIVKSLPADALSAILIALRDEDVTRTLYALTYQRETAPAPVKKVNTVCDLLLQAMSAAETATQLTLPILTAYFMHQPPLLEDAVSLIGALKQREHERPSITAEQALKYALVMVDVEALWRAALGTYALDLALFVAQGAQRDPREYMPILDELDAMAANMQRYAIDTKLGRHDRALKHLYESGDQWDACIRLIRSKSLFEVAINLVQKVPEHLSVVRRMFAEYHESMRNFEDAGMLFVLCGEHGRAAEMFRLSGNWQCALEQFSFTSESNEERMLFARTCAEHYGTLSKYSDAAAIYETICKDPQAAFHSYIAGQKWTQAQRVAVLAGLRELVSDVLLPTIGTAAAIRTEEFQQHADEAVKMRDRLVKVRAQKQQQLVQQQAGSADDYGDDTASLYSGLTGLTETSRRSQASGRSSQSGRSYLSKRRRQKQERRLLTPKAGTAGEEEALLLSLLNLVPSADVCTEVAALIRALLHNSMVSDATALQAALTSLQDSLQPFIDVWVTELRQVRELRRQTEQAADDNASQTAPVDVQIARPVIDGNWKVAWLTK